YSKHSYPAPAAHHQQHHPHHHHIPVKLEESPDLPPAPSAAHHHQHQHSNHPHHEHRHHKSQDAPLFRFGSDFGSSASPTSPAAPFTFMSQQWPGPAAAPSASSASGYAAHAHAHTQYAVDRAHYALPSSLNGHHAAMELNDDYDDPDGDELADLPSATLGGLSLPAYGSQAGTSLHGDGAGTKGEKQIRRRSSKACDQCRKSKCKCERGSPQDPCRNCVMLGTPCTFLGPSRKRGPPKGYIDAIEARLHQTEALIGILLGSKDSRARSVLEDISEVIGFWCSARVGPRVREDRGSAMCLFGVRVTRAYSHPLAHLRVGGGANAANASPACVHRAFGAFLDPLAKEIINRVDNSPYGHKGRARGGEAAPTGRSRPSAEARDESGLHSTQMYSARPRVILDMDRLSSMSVYGWQRRLTEGSDRSEITSEVSELSGATPFLSFCLTKEATGIAESIAVQAPKTICPVYATSEKVNSPGWLAKIVPRIAARKIIST
ncbi:predicted protein, partial [Postia placenta Mad-698-R]